MSDFIPAPLPQTRSLASTNQARFIFRVQNNAGIAPFRDPLNPQIGNLLNNDVKSRSLPTPWEEFGDRFVEGLHCCGSATLKGLNNWFGGRFETLRENGYDIFKLELPKDAVIQGKYQVIYDRNRVLKTTHIGFVKFKKSLSPKPCVKPHPTNSTNSSIRTRI